MDARFTDRLYSDALAELAAISYPTMAVVVPLLEKATRELGLTAPSRIEAAWFLAEHCIRRIAANDEPTLTWLTLLDNVTAAAADVFPNQSCLGDGLDVGRLIGIFWSYAQPNENYFEREKRVIENEFERRVLLDRLAREESRLWLTRRTTNSSFKHDDSASQWQRGTFAQSG
jgi:hypothetical protein